MAYILFGIPIALLLLFISCGLILSCKKKSALKKVRCMGMAEKIQLLDTLAEPVGYRYDPRQDIFTARLDAPQKIFGYTQFYDLSAPYFNMVFDYETIYFDHCGKTWLVELWKGQYGINTGCELGVYSADGIVPPEKYHSTLFKAVDADDMPELSLTLNRRCTKQHPRKNSCARQTPQCCKLGHMAGRHWWLTIFRIGCFSKPENLLVNASLSFPNQAMLLSFLEGFRQAMPDTAYRVNGLSIAFTFGKSLRKYSLYRRILRRLALFFSFFLCKWFHYVTRPFQNSGDKLVFAYCYLPFILRHIFRARAQE